MFLLKTYFKIPLSYISNAVQWCRNDTVLYILQLSTLCVNLLEPTCYVMHHQVNIQQLYALHTLYLCVLYLSQNKQRLVPLTA